MKIVNLNPASPPTEHADLPFTDSVAVERLLMSEVTSYGDADRWQQGLARVLREEKVFQVVSPPRPEEEVDLVLRGKLTGRFRSIHSNGWWNFVTWWPGPLFFMHNWRGTRFNYDTSADVELIDARTQEVVARFHAETRHKLIHRSSNPFPMIGAIIFIPGIVKGAVNIRPRVKYRQMIYAQAYPELWRQIAYKIVAERGPIYAQRARRWRESCGNEINTAPTVGTEWSKFVGCQTHRFRASGEEASPTGPVSLYTNQEGTIEVHVVDGWIVRWRALGKTPARGGARQR